MGLKPPRLVLVGAVTHDRVVVPPRGDSLSTGAASPRGADRLAGGAVLYAGAAALAAGVTPYVVTSHGSDFAWPLVAQGFERQSYVGETTMEFENRETMASSAEATSSREQRVFAECAPVPLAEEQIDAVFSELEGGVSMASTREFGAPGPTNWLVLAPVLGELDILAWSAYASARPDIEFAVLPQGFMRQLGACQTDAGRVSSAPWLPKLRELEAMVRWSLVALSVEELSAEPGLFDYLRPRTRLLAVTKGARGATLFTERASLEVPALPAEVVDATGAGDAFAGALIAGLARGASVEASAGLAAAAGALTVQSVGVAELSAPRLAELAREVRVREQRLLPM